MLMRAVDCVVLRLVLPASFCEWGRDAGRERGTSFPAEREHSQSHTRECCEPFAASRIGSRLRRWCCRGVERGCSPRASLTTTSSANARGRGRSIRAVVTAKIAIMLELHFDTYEPCLTQDPIALPEVHAASLLRG